jgi:hypothetical protein
MQDRERAPRTVDRLAEGDYTALQFRERGDRRKPRRHICRVCGRAMFRPVSISDGQCWWHIKAKPRRVTTPRPHLTAGEVMASLERTAQ